MCGVWNRLSAVLIIVLIICAVFSSGYFWYQLNITEIQLDTAKAQLVNTEGQLANAEKQLTNTKIGLDTIKSQLDNTQAELDAAQIHLNTTKNQLAMTTIQLESAKKENSKMLNQYASFREQINTRLGLTSQDMQSFITPDNLTVSIKVKEIAGSYSEDTNEFWRDYQRLYRWVVNNIDYSYDSPTPKLPKYISGNLTWERDYWRTPEETIENETGDCEDMATLLASMLRNYNQSNYIVWLLAIRSTFPKATAHLAIAFPVQGGKLTILDPAGNYYTGYQFGSLGAESHSVAVSRWLSHWSSKMPNAEIIQVFSENIYKQLSGTDEFLTWLQE
ncbi:transglutaminase-like domain-containing protein [Chloroflexota bacterium]